MLYFKSLTAIIILIILHQTSSQPTFSDNCQFYNTNNSVCQQCNPGFYLQYFFCVTCNPNCACINQFDFCQSCLTLSYNNLIFYSYLDESINQCFLCNSSMPFCLQCNNLNFCTKCYNGQYIVKTEDLDGVVIAQYCSSNICNINCQICLDNSHCKICQQGYFIFPNKTCSIQPCGLNCSICLTSSKCSVCVAGYYLNVPTTGVSACQLCMANCTECTTAANCLTCAPGFNFVNNSCASNGLSSCVEYTNDFTNCTGCEPGYEVTAGSCNQCTGCNLCSQQFICLSPCLPGYQPFNFACIPSFEAKLLTAFSFLIFIVILIH